MTRSTSLALPTTLTLGLLPWVYTMSILPTDSILVKLGTLRCDTVLPSVACTLFLAACIVVQVISATSAIMIILFIFVIVLLVSDYWTNLRQEKLHRCRFFFSVCSFAPERV